MEKWDPRPRSRPHVLLSFLQSEQGSHGHKKGVEHLRHLPLSQSYPSYFRVCS